MALYQAVSPNPKLNGSGAGLVSVVGLHPAEGLVFAEF